MKFKNPIMRLKWMRRCIIRFAWLIVLVLLAGLRWGRQQNLKNETHHVWDEAQILRFLKQHPSRAYFAHLFTEGGFRSGMEVGVADGRFSEHFLQASAGKHILWYMIEPFPNQRLRERFSISSDGTANFSNGTWSTIGLTESAHLVFIQELSTNKRLIRDIADSSLDFVYLDGAHDYKNVLRELPLYYRKIRPGGVLAGHDYCNRGEPSLPCQGCEIVPLCGQYTSYGIAHGKPANRLASNQAGVVRAVQEWLLRDEPKLRVHFTKEDFTRTGLKTFGMNYDLVITNTRNPSWYFIKPFISR